MPIQVDFGEELGRIEFPDDMSEEQVKDAVRKNRSKYRAALLGANQQLNERETAEQIKSGEIPVTVGERIGSIAASLVQGAAEGVASVPEFISKAAERLNQKLPLGEQVPAEEMTTGKLATSIRERANRWAEQIPGIEEEFWSGDVPRGLGQIGAMLTAGGAGSILGKAAARAAVTTAAFTAEAQDAFNRELYRQTQTGETEDKDQAMRRALVYATGATAIENWIGAGRMLRKYQKLFGKTPDEAAANMVREGIPMGPIRAFLGKTIKETGVGAVEEGLQRGLQDLIIDRKLDPDAILREAAVGGVVQGIASAPANVLEARGQAPAAPGQRQAPPPPSTTPRTDATLESEFDEAIKTVTPEPGTLIRPDLQAQVGTPPPAPGRALVPATPTAEVVAPGSEEEQAAKFREVMAGIDAEIAAKTGPAPKFPELPERVETVDDLMAFRERRKAAEIEFLKSIGLDEQKARRLWAAGDEGSTANVDAILDSLTEEQAAAVRGMDTMPDAYGWNSRFNPNTVATDTEVGDVAASLAANVAAGGIPTNFGDKFLHAAVALRRIKELGGTWQDVAKALDGVTTRKSGSQSDKTFVFRKWGEELKRFAQQQGIELPLEPAPARPATPPALAAAARQAEQAGAPLTAQAVVSTAQPAPTPESRKPVVDIPAPAPVEGGMSTTGETVEHASRIRALEDGSLLDANGEVIKPGDGISMKFMGGPTDMPTPWTLVRAENYFSNVNYKLNPQVTVRAANGAERTYRTANVYSPRKLGTQANALPIQSPSPSLPRQEGPQVGLREVVPGNQQPQETPGQTAETKAPELMTPEEFSASGRDVELPKNIVLSDNHGNYVTKEKDGSYKIWRAGTTYATLAGTIGFKSEEGMRRAKDRLKEVSSASHKEKVTASVQGRRPVSAAAVDAYGIKLPEGYVREGDRYVFKGGEQPNAQEERPQEGVQQVAPAPTAPAPADTGAGEGLRSIEEFDIEAWLSGEEFQGIPRRVDNYREGSLSFGKDPTIGRRIQQSRRAKQRQANLDFFMRDVFPNLAPQLTKSQRFEIAKTAKSVEALQMSGFRLWKKGDRQTWLETGDPREAKAIELGAAIERNAVPWDDAQPSAPGSTLRAAAKKVRSRKAKPNDTAQMVFFPGLSAADARAIYNTVLDVVATALEAGASIAEAIERAIADLRYRGVKNVDEAKLRAHLRTLYEDPEKPPAPTPAARSGEMKETQGRRAAPPESGIPGAGLYPGYSEEKARQEAADFISGLSNEDAFRKVMDPLDPVDPVLKPYVFTAIVDRIKTEYDALGDPKDGTADAAQKNKLRELMFTVEDAGQKAGSVSGQNLQAQQGAVRGKEGLINWLRTMNVWRDKRNERLKKEGVPTEVAEPAKKKARKTALEKLESDEGLLSFIKRFLKTENINLRELFRDLPETRKERIAEIVRRLLADPMFSALSVEDRKKIGVRIEETFQRLQKEELEKALKSALEGRSKKVKDAVEDAMPELVRQMNLGMLTDEKFREMVAEKLGIPQLTEDQARRLEKLGEQVQKEKVQFKRNRLMYQMVELLAESGVSWGDIANDSWFANVLSSPRTTIDVLTGGTGQLLSVTFRAALDAAGLQGRPDVAAKMVAQAIGDYARGLANAVNVIATGDYSRIPGYEKKLKDILAGKIRPDSLEILKKSPNPIKKTYGQISYVRRFMVAADYAGALGVRNVGLLYAALSRGETEQLNALMKKLQKAEKNAALEQAKKDLGPEAPMVDVWARQQEIIEEGISQDIRDSSERLSSLVALTAEPTGLLGAVYKMINSLPEPYRGPLKKLTGTTFFRAAANMVNMALEWMPLSGLVNPIRALPYWQTLPENSFLRKFALDLPPEQRRLMFYAQALTYPLTLLLWNAFDDDDEFGIEGNWFGVSPEKKKQLLASGARQLSIRVGNTYISFKNTPIAAPLAFIANMQDQKKYNRAKWDEASAGEKLANGWLMGMMYVKDLAAVSQLSNLFGQLNTSQMPEVEPFLKRMAASVGSTLGGYIPLVSLQRDIDSILDPKIYKPNGGFEAWVRNVPYLRRTVGQGPDLNMIGQEIQAARYPWGRWVSSSPDDPVIEVIGRKAAQGVFVPMPQKIDVFDPRTRQKREQTDAEFYRYTKEVLQGYGKWFRNRENLRRFDRAKPTEAAEILDRELSQIREAARARARQRALSASAR